jgi:O-antigen/teichoic acid export membrane protein
MTAQEKLAFGMSAFVALFVLAFLVIPGSVYQRYFADLKRRKRERLVKPLLAIVALLSLPYFYDELVGFDRGRLSDLLGFVIGACAYLVLIDVAWFAYKNYGPPSHRRKHAGK